MIRTFTEIAKTGGANLLAGFSTLGFNTYTIVEVLKDQAFPIILAIGSLVLTSVMIFVQIKKVKLINQQLKNECAEGKKLDIEIEEREKELISGKK